jgi:hypothetical protein
MLTRRNVVLVCCFVLLGIGLGWWQPWSRPSAPIARPLVRQTEATGLAPLGATPLHFSGSLPPPLATTALRQEKPAPVFTSWHPALLARRERWLGDDFVRAFALDSAETQAIQRIVDRGFRALEQRALENATVLRPAPDTLKVRVRPFDGAAVYDELMNSLQTTLGAARYRSFVAAYGVDVDVAFYSFGAERREIEIKRQSPHALVVKELRTSHDSEIDGEPVTYMLIAELQSMLGRLVELVPADF